MSFIKTMRWFGDNDPVSLEELKQTGIEGVVTALHHIANGGIWPVEEIREVKNRIEKYGLSWTVVESLPVSEEIKTAGPNRKRHIENYKQSVRNLGECGITTVVYNFMPVLDWVRTDLAYRLPEGGQSMLFHYPTFAAFDIFILKRPDAEKDYPEGLATTAKKLFEKMGSAEAEKLAHDIIVVTQGFIDGVTNPSVADYKKTFLGHIRRYEKIGKQELRENLAFFINEIVPVAEESGVNLAIHPDDPPFPVLGLPRIVSTADDLEWLARVNPSLANGITFCTGSFSARTDNNLPEMAKRFGGRIHFAHLRNTVAEPDGSFYESGHLNGRVNMYEVVKNLVEEQNNRKKSGRKDFRIPMRPDHGIKILDDFQRRSNPGYPLIGRLKGLAELSGLEKAIEYISDGMG